MKNRLVTYLVGTQDEMMGISELKNNLRQLDKAIDDGDLLRTISSLAEAARSTIEEDEPKSERRLNLEVCSTLGYLAASVATSIFIPAVGIPFATDSFVRCYRMSKKTGCPVGVIGTIREYLEDAQENEDKPTQKRDKISDFWNDGL